MRSLQMQNNTIITIFCGDSTNTASMALKANLDPFLLLARTSIARHL
jgi:hypothetical protein